MQFRNKSIDALRGVAILLVLSFHLGVPYISLTSQVGVDLFFVLSGFLISGLLFNDIRRYGTIRLKRFWVRRAFKILPPLYAFLLFWLLLLRSRPTWDGVVNSILFCMNYFPVRSVFMHTWSLSVEEQFYLLLPLLLVALIRWVPKPFDKLPWIFAGIVVVITCLRVFIPDPSYNRFDIGYFHLRCDMLFSGVMLRYMNDFKPIWFQRLSRFAFIPGLLFWVPAVLLRLPCSSLTHSLLNSGLDLGCCCLTAWCFRHDADRLWTWAPFRLLSFIGFYSYSIYLWHFPIVNYAVNYTGLFGQSILRYSIGFTISILVGVGMAKLIEVPALRLREKLTASKSPTLIFEESLHAVSSRHGPEPLIASSMEGTQCQSWRTRLMEMLGTTRAALLPKLGPFERRDWLSALAMRLCRRRIALPSTHQNGFDLRAKCRVCRLRALCPTACWQ